MTRHHDVATSDLGLAAKAAATIADQQVRNRGTIGGTLAHGDPASDLPAVLLALEGSVVVRGESGEREIAAADLFQDYLTTSLAEGEILTEVRLPSPDGWGAGYAKFNRRVEDWAMVAVCAAVRKAADGSCEDVRIGLTNMGGTPLRATAAEEALRGRGLDARLDRGGGRAGGGGHRPARRPQRVRGLQAPPGARAVPPRAGGGGRRGVTPGSVEDVEQALAGEGYLPDRGLATSVFLALDPRAAAAARGRGGGRQDGGRAGAGDGARRAADPAAVPRGDRPAPRRLRLGLPAPAPGHPRDGGGRCGARPLRAGVPRPPAAARGARGRRGSSCS